MRKCKLGKLLDVTRGVSLSGAYCVSEGERVRLTLANFDYVNNCFQEDRGKDNLFYSKEVPSKFILDAGSIITPLTEQTPGLLGCTARIPESGKYIQSQDVGLIKPFEDVLDHDFAYYLVSSKGVKDQLAARSQQTKIRHTSPDKIKDCTVFVPELADQRKIGKFLSSVDRLIELSRKRIENLEKLAKEIYDYWFVQFDFPDKRGKPYKSSGGKMVYNVTLKREIPAGWKAQSLPEVLSLTMGQSPDGKSYNEAGAGTLFYQGATDFGCTFPSPRQYTTSPSRMAGSGAVLMSVRAPVGTKNRVLDECCIGRGLCALFSENGGTSFAWYVAESLKPYFDRKNNDGTTFGAIGKDEFSKLMILSPSEDVVKEFGKLVKPLDLAMVKAQRHIDLLVKAREFLLPLLMNGQAKMR